MKRKLSFFKAALLSMGFMVGSLEAGQLCKSGGGPLRVIMDIVDEEIPITFVELDKNEVSSKASILELKKKIRELWDELKSKDYVTREGSEAEWRAAFISLQAILEKAQAIALKNKQIDRSKGFILTPRMPSSLMIKDGKNFSQVNIKMPIAFAEVRRTILEEYMEVGAKLYAIYSSDAMAVLSSNKDHIEGVHNYQALKDRFQNNLMDCPLINIPMHEFPLDQTGAWYVLNDNLNAVIAIHSYQISQSPKVEQKATWFISLGSSAQSRLRELNVFLKCHNAANLSTKHLFGNQSKK